MRILKCNNLITSATFLESDYNTCNWLLSNTAKNSSCAFVLSLNSRNIKYQYFMFIYSDTDC